MKYLFIVLLFFLTSRFLDCDKFVESERQVHFNIVISEILDDYPGRFQVRGINPITKKEERFGSMNRWFGRYTSEMSQGDTLVKKKGEMLFRIHKKDTILEIFWECKGKVYC